MTEECRTYWGMPDTRWKRAAMMEDGLSGSGVPANNMGGGKIAGAGIGSQGEPGVNPQRKRKRILTDILKRTFPKTG